MRSTKRTPVLIVLALLASLLTFISSRTAVAAESIPELHWPAVVANGHPNTTLTSPKGDVSVACSPDTYKPQDLTTYGPTGSVVRRISRASKLDGVANCIKQPVVDKNGTLYGAPTRGSNLLAYDGNTIRWKYQFNCTDAYHQVWPVVGADGNVYGINSAGRLIDLSPKLAFGQIQPTKVLDVTTIGHCGDELRAFDNGIVLISRSTAGATVAYYTYTGKSLGEVKRSYWGDTTFPINASGRLFYLTSTGDTDPLNLNVSAYDPVTKKVAWSTQVSTPGVKVEEYEGAYPLPNGGVVVVIRQQKMTSDDTPASPLEYVTILVTLDSTGKKVRTQTLPGRDDNGDSFSDSSYAVDTKGKFVVVRERRQTLDTNPWYMPTVDIKVFDTVTGNVTYQGEMRGNRDGASGSVYGYALTEWSHTSSIGINTLYVKAVKCTIDCGASNVTKLYAIKVPGLGLDYPRGAVLGRVPRSAAPYVALGDSFSSGEGVSPFETGTTLNANTCHRSTRAYPRLIAGTSAKIPSLGSSGFRACSGAETKHVMDVPQWNEGTQLDLWPDRTTKVVTLTIGGNDIGFGNFGLACAVPFASCVIGSSPHNTAVNKINNELPGKLEETYKKILKFAPNAKVYVLGYPQIIAEKAPNAAYDARCLLFYDPVAKDHWADVRAARDIVTKLNAKISATVAKVRSQSSVNLRLKYVPVDGSGSPFKGHEACGPGTSWFLNVDQALQGRVFVFHPNKLGQEGYATAAKAAINAG